ncbi:modulator of smoothened protein isoform 2-T2 [Sarcophilus harrisii]
MDKLTIISGCLFLAADIFAIASIANPDWINTGESAGSIFISHPSTLEILEHLDICPAAALPFPSGTASFSGPETMGALTVGLVRQCQTIHGRDRTCIPPRLPPEWVTTLFFIIMGIISLTVTCGLLVASHWRREATKYARWIAFTGMILFCMAALIFPIGFYINEVGGQPYKLPNNTVVGSSYVLFVLSIFFTIVGLLFAGKVCLPG